MCRYIHVEAHMLERTLVSLKNKASKKSVIGTFGGKQGSCDICLVLV